MFARNRPLRDAVNLTLDGRSIAAERGEPIAMALLAHGERVLVRSPKLHRPRSATCLRGDCDGCIARVDGVPNVMTCRRSVGGGEVVVAQNVLGSRKHDLLRLTDWFFPKGIDHHHLLAGVPGVSDLMQTFARQMAGIGRLPDAPRAPLEASTLAVDVLVVGGGLAGLEVARSLRDLEVEHRIVDEGPALGTWAGSLPTIERHVRDLAERASGDHLRATAVGVFEGQVLLVTLGDRGEELGAVVVRPRAIVFATGAHDGALLVPGNDLPGVVSARAGALLASRGITPTARAVLIGDGAWADALADALTKGAGVERLAEDEVESLDGTTGVREIRTRDGRTLDAEVVFVDAVGAPSFELAAQAGAETRRTKGGFAVLTSEDGEATLAEGAPGGPRLFATGECAGLPFSPEELAAHASRTARAVSRALGGAQPSTTASNKPKPPATKMKPKSPSKAK